MSDWWCSHTRRGAQLRVLKLLVAAGLVTADETLVMREKGRSGEGAQGSGALLQSGTLLSRLISRLLSSCFPESALPPRVLLLRWMAVSVASFLAYVLLDRSTVDLQIWRGISAWYPPIGLCVAACRVPLAAFSR